MSHYIIGLTGGIGSGKSAASDYFTTLGINVVDADVVAREVVEPGTPALAHITERFGNDILCNDGSLNRAALRKIVFEKAEQRLWLEQLTHPLIADAIAQQLKNATSDYVILSSPLLLETSQHNHCNKIIVVDVPEAIQLERTTARDNNNEAQIKRIMAAQSSRKQRLAKADFVLDNTGTLENLYQQIDTLHQQLLIHSDANSKSLAQIK